MKAFIAVFVLSIFIEPSSAFECMACDLRNASASCNVTYVCEEGVNVCETIVSKVEGDYSVSASCATKQKCGNGNVTYGLELCDHSLPNTECYSCCATANCNKIDKAFAAEIFALSQSYKSAVLEKVEAVNATLAEPVVEVEEEPIVVAEEEPKENVDKVNNLAESDLKKMEQGLKVGDDKIDIGNETSVNETLEVAKNVSTAGIGLIETKTILNDTTEEEEYFEFTTASLNVDDRNNETVSERAYDTTAEPEEPAGEQHALEGKSGCGISKLEVAALLANLIIMKLFL